MNRFSLKIGSIHHAHGGETHLLSFGPWSLWWGKSVNPTQCLCNIRATTVYLLQVSPCTHLSIVPKEEWIAGWAVRRIPGLNSGSRICSQGLTAAPQQLCLYFLLNIPNNKCYPCVMWPQRRKSKGPCPCIVCSSQGCLVKKKKKKNMQDLRSWSRFNMLSLIRSFHRYSISC